MKNLIYLHFLIVLVACSAPMREIKNDRFGKLKNEYQIKETGLKNFPLDSVTAIKPQYMQLLNEETDTPMLSILNKHTNSIYLYNYATSEFIGSIAYEREGPNGILEVSGYYVKNMDSIYIFNRPLLEMDLADSTGIVKQRIALREINSEWSKFYPQYNFCTACPIWMKEPYLILTGLYPFNSTDDWVGTFKYTAYLNMNTNEVSYCHLYPEEIFGDNVNWDDPVYTQVYSTLSSANELIHSFTNSHNLYISPLLSDSLRTVYGGSNQAHAIKSIDWDASRGHTPRELISKHYISSDVYTSILHDPWRHVYYRYMLQGVSNASQRTSVNQKNIVVIVYDENFNYLGESVIGNGKQYHWENSFVSEDGLNVEYNNSEDTDEDFLNLKIFTIEKK